MNSGENTTPTTPPAPVEGISDIPMEIVDIEGESRPPSLAESAPPRHETPPKPGLGKNVSPIATYPGGFTIDVCFEASKLPLDVAIFNSARAAGGDEKIRKYLQAVLVVGGTALIPGMAHALESRFVGRF